MRLVFQAAANDCGPACLQMVAQYFGKTVSADDLSWPCAPGPDGMSMAQLADAAERAGLRGLVARVGFDHLDRLNLPCIAHCDGTHFVVIERVAFNRVRLADPMTGRVVLSAAEFRRRWAGQNQSEGTVLLLEPSHDAAEERRFRFYWQYVRAHRWQIAQVLLSVGVGSVLQLLIAFVTRALVDAGIAQRSMRFVYVILASQLVMFVSRVANDFLRGWVMLHLTARMNVSILADFLKKLTRVPAAYLERKPVGDMLQRIGDHGRVQSFLTSSVLSAVSAVTNLVLFGVVLAMLSPRIAALFVAAAAALMTWMITFAGKRRALDQQRFLQAAETQTSLVQMIGGMRDIRLGTCEREKRAEWERLQARQMSLGLRGLALTQHMQGGAMAISELKNILISCFAAAEVIRGEMTLGTMLAISYMIGNLNGPVDQLVSLFQSGQDAKISIDRITEVYAQTDDDKRDSAALAVPQRMDILIDDVSFAYPGSAGDVLRGVSLDIPQGARVAIVGSSGSGKTTLVKLLTKLYQPRAGGIFVDGLPLRDIDTTQWRRRCGVVLQDGYLFSDTLAHNIALGSDFCDFSRVRRACSVAQLDDLIRRLPDGLRTRIGPSGHELSAGERQRLLIARALYKEPDIFIFDEASSALDGATERALLRSLEAAVAGRTVITIAHRLSTIIDADRIVVLERGELAEHGTHAELVSSRRGYYHLVRNQLELGA